jgi:hypothetical protein
MWADEQRSILEAELDSLAEETEAAEAIVACGGNPGKLRCVYIAGVHCSVDAVGEWASKLNDVVIVGEYAMDTEMARAGHFDLSENAAVVSPGGLHLLFRREPYAPAVWPARGLQRSPTDYAVYDSHTMMGIVIARVASAWHCPVEPFVRQANEAQLGSAVAGSRGGEAVKLPAVTISRARFE